MFSEVIKLIPQLEQSALNKMFNSLSKRFTSVAKGFGKGLQSAMRAAPWLALISTVVAKLVSPLEKAEEIIDKILGKSGDLTDSAEELGTTPGALARLEAVGRMKGVDEATMRTLLTKFQTDLAQERTNAAAEQKAVAEGRKPTTQPGVLRNFIDMDDTAEAFFQFVQALQNLSPDERTLAQTVVFGERVRGKASPFFNERDFAGLLAELPSVDQYNKAIGNADQIGDKLDRVRTINDEWNLIKTVPLIKPSFVDDIGSGQQKQFKQEQETLKRYEANKQMYLKIQQVLDKGDEFLTKMINEIAPSVIKAIDMIENLVNTVQPYVDKMGMWSAEKLQSVLDTIERIPAAIDSFYEKLKKLPFVNSVIGGSKK